MPLALIACRGEVIKHSCVKCEAQRRSMRSSGWKPSGSALILGALCLDTAGGMHVVGRRCTFSRRPIRVEEEGPVSI
jgi:hypothetical protein